jgi:hypothetical protein
MRILSSFLGGGAGLGVLCGRVLFCWPGLGVEEGVGMGVVDADADAESLALGGGAGAGALCCAGLSPILVKNLMLVMTTLWVRRDDLVEMRRV